MKRISKKALKIILAVDAAIAVGFGVYSWIFPYKTFGTIIAIPEGHSAVFTAILASLSLFYILIGLTCLIGVRSHFPTNILIGTLMLLRHLLEGVLKIAEMREEWLIGSPYPDLIIHALFILVYIVAMYGTYRFRRNGGG